MKTSSEENAYLADIEAGDVTAMPALDACFQEAISGAENNSQGRETFPDCLSLFPGRSPFGIDVVPFTLVQ